MSPTIVDNNNSYYYFFKRIVYGIFNVIVNSLALSTILKKSVTQKLHRIPFQIFLIISLISHPNSFAFFFLVAVFIPNDTALNRMPTYQRQKSLNSFPIHPIKQTEHIINSHHLVSIYIKTFLLQSKTILSFGVFRKILLSFQIPLCLVF